MGLLSSDKIVELLKMVEMTEVITLYFFSIFGKKIQISK